MKIKTYGLYDKVAKQIVRTFTARNDDDASRSGKYIVREQNFDPIAGCDMDIWHLYDVESETGIVENNDITIIISLKDAYEEYQRGMEKKDA